MQINPIRVAGSFALGFSLFVSILGGQFKLVPGLNQINKNENDNYKIKGAFFHRMDLIIEKIQLSFMSSFGDQHHPDDKKDE